jgi:uncharacterized protein (TIGR03083 family)
MTVSTVRAVNPSGERVAALAAENALLLDFLRKLSPEDWARPSACDRWSIADVVAHLTIAANLDRLPEALGGTPVGQPARPTEDEFRENLGTGPIVLRKQLSADLLSTFEGKWARFIDTLSRLAPEEWNLLAGPRVDIRITEHAMHSWDTRSRFDTQATFLPTSLRALCDKAAPAVHRAFRPDPSRARPIRYRFIVGAPHTVSHDLILSAEGGRYQAPPEGEADVSFEADTPNTCS